MSLALASLVFKWALIGELLFFALLDTTHTQWGWMP